MKLLNTYVNRMKGLAFQIEGIYFACFRKVSSTSVVLSYSVPPFTTLRGLLANCLGLPRFPNYKVQLILKDIKIGMQPLNLNEINKNKTTEICKLLKLIEREAAARPKIWAFPSAPLFKELLINPRYEIYLVGDINLLEKIYEKLQNPERPLYLGQSDDMIDIIKLKIMEIEKTKSNKIWSIIRGIHEGCEIIKLPYKFSDDGKNLEEITISVPPDFPFSLDKEVDCYKFGTKYACVY